jgi:stage II sporulation protein D
MRRFALPAAILVVLACAASAAASPVFVLSGHGWGHGVGMSQYGALGRALNGDKYKSILRFYYDGTQVRGGGQSKIRVLLTEGRSAVTLRSSGSFRVGARKLAPFTDYRVVPVKGGKVRVIGKGKFASPATVRPGSGFLRLDGLRYRGDMKIFNHGGGLDVVNVLSLQGYLFSVVPREMPADWPLEALKAQAVAARSYAVRAARASWFDIYDDTRDQVYGGLDYSTGEEPRTTAAVKATAGKVVRYKGSIASTYFSSSNGGRSAASADTWGGSLPYLVSKPDRFDLNAHNPNRSWKTVLSAHALQKRLGAGHRPGDALVTLRASGRVDRIRLQRGSWSQTFPSSGLGPEYFRTVLGLRSSRFQLGVLNVKPARRMSVCRERVRLNLVVRHVNAVTLQRRPTSGGAWAEIPVTKVDSEHYYAVNRLCRGTSYRLHSPVATTKPVDVKVAPKIVFAATQPAHNGLRGTVRPLSLAGRTVRVDRLGSSGWIRNVGTAVVESDGTWHARFNAVAGTYRARIAPPPSTGLVPGVSPVLNFG